MNIKKIIQNFLLFAIIFFIIALMFSSFSGLNNSVEKVDISYLIQNINQEKVSDIVVEGDTLHVSLINGEKKDIKKEGDESLSKMLNNFGISAEKMSKIKISVKDESSLDYWIKMLIPILLPFLLIGGLIFFMMRGVQGANSKAMMFGQSKAKQFIKNKKEQITFKDVAGSKEAKVELQEIVEFLKHPKKFHDLGARIPKGFLLLGAPGTGKTLMSRAVAGEADVPFFHISGSEFVEMFVGVGASRVRDLFKQAKKNTPCVIFIDEIDAVARRRGAGIGGSHDEREQTLNQILVEMDGFDKRVNVIVIAATNRPDVLDPALLRPGRFDRRVYVDYPDIKERIAILKVHARKKKLADNVELKRIAERTPGFSGADLENLLNEAAITAARQNEKSIKMKHLYDAIEKTLLGPEKKSKVMSKKEKEITAYHEAGHALVSHALQHTDPVQKVSIIARGRAGGYTLKVPLEDKKLQTKLEYVEELSVLLAGYLAEKKIFKDVTTGASSDLEKATKLARSLVTEFGMADNLELRTFGTSDERIFMGKEMHEGRDYSEKTAERIDEAVNHFLNIARKKAEEILNSQQDKLKNIADGLLKYEVLEKEEFEKIVNK